MLPFDSVAAGSRSEVEAGDPQVHGDRRISREKVEPVK